MTGILSRAAALERDGRWREAIELLTAANRDRRHADIERRLVQVRHEAFAHLHPRPSGLVWTAPTAEIPPGSPPEVGRDELTCDVLAAAIAGAGCLLVRELLSPAQVAQLTDDINRAFAAFDLASHGQGSDEEPSWFCPFVPSPAYPPDIGRRWVRQGGGVLAADSPRALFDVLGAVEQAGGIGVITHYLGENPLAISVKKTTLRIVPADTNTAWHQDGAFLGAGIRALNVWLALTRCGDDAPGLDILPRRLDHIVETGTAGAYFDWVAAPDVVERAAAGVDLVSPLFGPGDALLFDHLFMHRTGAGPGMRRERHAIEMWFFAPSHYPPGHPPLVVYG
jgi:hypothetical protein